MILTIGHKRLKPRNKRSKSKNKHCINKKNYKSKNGRKSTVKILSNVLMKE